MTNNTITGTYKTRRENGGDYSFEVTWVEVPGGVAWTADVKKAGMQVGAPNGSISESDATRYAELVRRSVVRCIEHAIGVN